MKNRFLLLLFGFCFLFLASCVKEPQPIKVTGITLNATSLSLVEGESSGLVATISPKDADNQLVLWSSNNGSVASVNNGKVSALAPGSATITAKTDDGGFTASCSVTIAAKTVDVASVSLSRTELTLTEGDSETITATVTPDNATDKTVTWSSSDAAVATVDGGKITAVKEGTVTITAKAGGKTATCKVTVEKRFIAVESVELDKTEIELLEGESATLVATVKPDDATDKRVTWISSDPSIASVDDGKVTALKVGSTIVTASAGGKKATCSVTVSAATVSVTGVSLDKTAMSMTVGDTQTLTATVTPSNATNKSVTWSSNNTSVATISYSGVVTAKTAGSATITVTTDDGGKKATCSVTVSAATVSVTGVSLDKTAMSMTVGDTQTLTATVTPSNATNKSVTWSSNNTSVATVSSSGVVTAKNAGSATITVTTNDGDKEATCSVKVIKSESHEAIDLGLSIKWASCNVGASKPEEYGDYFAWGETEPRSADEWKHYNWEDYKWCVMGDPENLNKYNTKSNYGKVDNKTLLEMSDDAARANWGGKWRMPSDGEWIELLNNCTWTWTIQNGKNGYKVTSKKNGNSIFLPAAGRWFYYSFGVADFFGGYWSSTLCTITPFEAYHLLFYSEGVNIDRFDRIAGFSVRPVTD